MKKILVIGCCIISYIGFSQEVTPEVMSSGGGYFEQANGSVSFTIGEIMTETFEQTSATITQGFQQSDLLSTEIEEDLYVEFDVNVFPNPAGNLLTIDFAENLEEDISYSLTDISGKTLQNGSIEKGSQNTQLNVQPLAAGVYFLKLSNAEEETYKTYKIQKSE